MYKILVKDAVKMREFIIASLLNHSTRVYMDELYRCYQKHLIRLDNALIETDLEVLSEYAEVLKMDTSDLNKYMRVFKWSI